MKQEMSKPRKEVVPAYLQKQRTQLISVRSCNSKKLYSCFEN